MPDDAFQNTGFLTPEAKRPPGGKVVWTRAADDVRLRVGLWPAEAAKGTVLIFSGRTEFIEKYGPAAVDYAARGYATATLDWRGQGLSDRLLDDPKLGHVKDYLDYQLDVAAFMKTVEAEGLPKPYFLMAHSMGGAIGLRSLIDGLDVAAVAFSAPMWSLILPPLINIGTVRFLGALCQAIHMCNHALPGRERDNYVLIEKFEDNALTTDPEMWDFMVEVANACPELTVAAPTINWAKTAIFELERLKVADLPDVSTYVALGDDETVVDPEGVRAMTARWPAAHLEIFEGCRHEVVMSTPDHRKRFFDATAAHFDMYLGDPR